MNTYRNQKPLKLRGLFLLPCLLLTMAILICAGIARPRKAYAADRLQVVGTQLCDSAGNPVALHGVSTHGIAWYPQYVNEDAFRTLRDDWHVNVIRLAMYTQEYGGYAQKGNRARLKQLIDQGVSAADHLGMYVIIDWHILSDGNPMKHARLAAAFFSEMSAKYGSRGNVLYEICNEPNGSKATWKRIRTYANKIIPVIRQNDPDGIILVGTPTWSQDVDQVAAAPVDNSHNVMYTVHFYAATHKDWNRDKVEKAIAAGTPVFISEFSICADGRGKINRKEAARWWNLIRKYNLSCVGWSLANKKETCSLIKSSCKKTSGFTNRNLTAWGKWLRKKYH